MEADGASVDTATTSSIPPQQQEAGEQEGAEAYYNPRCVRVSVAAKCARIIDVPAAMPWWCLCFTHSANHAAPTPPGLAFDRQGVYSPALPPHTTRKP